MGLREDAAEVLAALEGKGRLRGHRRVSGTPGASTSLFLGAGELAEVHNFSSNDYLGLAGDVRLQEAAIEVMRKSGVGSTASRLILTHEVHDELEEELASWLEVERAQLFGSGYAANVGIVSTLAGPGDVVFSDQLNHASLIDGCRLSRAQVVIYQHADLVDLEAQLRATVLGAGQGMDPWTGAEPRAGARAGARAGLKGEAGGSEAQLEAGARTKGTKGEGGVRGGAGKGGRKFIVSESVFSMDGDIADVAGLARLAKQYDATFILDEAHAIGAIGPQGRGVAAARGVIPDLLVGTFGKAFGSHGAFVAGAAEPVEWLWNRARSLVFSTGLPPMISGATRCALELIRGPEGDLRRQLLAANAQRLAAGLGLEGKAVSHIVPWLIGSDSAAVQASQQLLSQGYFAQAIRPPTVPEGTARLRLAVGMQPESAIDGLIAAIRAL